MSGQCDYPRRAGFVCSQNFQCSSNSCVNGICQNTVNYGDSCILSSSGCPFDAYCDSGTSKCIQYAGNGANCTSIQCGPIYYCDTVSSTCKMQNSIATGQPCNGGGCLFSAYCNMTGNTGTCALSSSRQGLTCLSNGLCGNSNFATNGFYCTCNSGSTSCLPIYGNNCDSIMTTFFTCVYSNCPYSAVAGTFVFDSDQCLIQKCKNELTAGYCCIYNTTTADNHLVAQTQTSLLKSLNCNSNTYIGSPCQAGFNPNSSTKFLPVTIYTAIIVFVIHFILII